MEKIITLYYDYITTESFFGDVEYVIEQNEGIDVEFEITDIFETVDDNDEDCFKIHYIIK